MQSKNIIISKRDNSHIALKALTLSSSSILGLPNGNFLVGFPTKFYICFLSSPYEEYEGVPKTFRTGRLERELQMVQLSATRCSCIAIL